MKKIMIIAAIILSASNISLAAKVESGQKEQNEQKEKNAPEKLILEYIKLCEEGKNIEARKDMIKPSDEKMNKGYYRELDKVCKMMSDKEVVYSIVGSKIQKDWAVVGVKVVRELENEGNKMKSGWLRDEFLYFDGEKWSIVPLAIRNLDPEILKKHNENYKDLRKWWSEDFRKKKFGRGKR